MSDVDKERSKVKLTWNDAKDAFEYFRPNVVRVTITLAQLRQMVHTNQEELERRLQDLLPPSFPLSDAMDLPWDTLQASQSEKQSFLDCKDAWDLWLKSVVEKVTAAYLASHGASATSFNHILDKDREFQKVLIAVIMANTGVPPRCSALRAFAYRSALNYLLNLHAMMGSLTIMGGQQKMDTRWDGGVRDFVVRALPPAAGKMLIVYLAVCRQALAEVMRLRGWHQHCWEAYKSKLFATYRIKAEIGRSSQPDGSWNMVDIISAWHGCSEPHLGVKLSMVDMRQLITGIYREHFPTLLYGPKVEDTAVTLQGDHNAKTTEKHYGRNHEHRGGISEFDAQSFIRASQTYQALMQTAPVSPDWPKDILAASCFNFEENTSKAMKLASHLVSSDLMRAGVSPVQIKASLEERFKALPFIYTSKVILPCLALFCARDLIRACRETSSLTVQCYTKLLQ